MDPDYHLDTLKPGLLSALRSERSRHVVIAWAQAISEFAVSADEIGSDWTSTDQLRAGFLSRANRIVCDILRFGSDLEHVSEDQLDQFVDRYFDLAAFEPGAAWPVRKALALTGHTCGACGYWHVDDLGEACPHCRANPSHIMQAAREVLQTADASTAVTLQNYDGDDAETIRAIVPELDPATTLMLTTYATSVWPQPQPFEDREGPERDSTGANLLDPIRGIFAMVFADPDDAFADTIELDAATLPLAEPFRARLEELGEA